MMINSGHKMSTNRKYIQEELEWLKVQEKNAQEVFNELKLKSRQVERNTAEATKQVTDFANELIRTIEHSKNKLLHDIIDLKNILLRKVSKEKNIYELRIKDLQKTRESLNKLLLKTSRGSCNEETVHNTLDRHVLTTNPKPADLDPTIRFDKSEDALQLKLLEAIGTVNIIEEVDCSKCFIEEFNTKFEAFSVVKLCLRTFTADRKPCIVLKHMVRAEIRPKKHISNLEIVEGPIGIIKLTFLPRISGKFVLRVEINGKEVKDSPLSILIEPRTLKTKRKITLKEAGLKSPCGLAITPDFTKIAVSDAELHCIAVFTSDGKLLRKIGKAGTREGRLSYPDGLAFLNDHELVVADRDNHRVQIFDTDTGHYLRSVGKKSRVKKQFKSPWGVSVDCQQQIIVSDTYNRRVQIFNARGGQLVKEYSFEQHGESTLLPARTLSYKHFLLVADAFDNSLHIIDQNDGPLVTIETTGSSRDSLIESLNGIAMDRDENIAVCDGGSVKLFTLEGNFIGKTNMKMYPVDLVSLPDGSLLVIEGISGELLVIK